MDKVSFFILNICLNSILAFFTAVLFIESLIFLCRIGPGRISAILRAVPMIKLPVDLFLYDFSRWSYVKGINPLDCEEGTRTLSVMCGWVNQSKEAFILPIRAAIKFTVSGDLTFTIADMIGYSTSPLFLQIFAQVFIGLTIGCIIREMIRYTSSLRALESLIQNSRPSYRGIDNPILSSSIRKSGVQILTSPAIKGSPFVTGLTSFSIYISEDLLKKLSQAEYEAVITHEMEHVRYRDSLMRLILHWVAKVFWWIPTQALRRRIEEGQEMACDLRCTAYGIELTTLASAICKSARHATKCPSYSFANHLTKHATLKRIRRLVETKSDRFTKAQVALACLALSVAFLVILPGRLWIF